MFVCICRAVTEDEVHEHCDSGARTVDAISDKCGAGEGCGTCLERLHAIVAERNATATSAA
ncbi:(2Fe-2S)-binding protein [Gordonia sp. NPDC003376]